MRLGWIKKKIEERSEELKYIAPNVIVVRCIFYILKQKCFRLTIDIARMSILLHFIKCLWVNVGCSHMKCLAWKRANPDNRQSNGTISKILSLINGTNDQSTFGPVLLPLCCFCCCCFRCVCVFVCVSIDFLLSLLVCLFVCLIAIRCGRTFRVVVIII